MNGNNSWAGRRVLVVDDSATARTWIAELLRGLPLELEQASSAEEFLEKTSRHSYDLILLDLRLAGEDGIDLLQNFRRDCQTTAVVLITGQASLSSATDALAAGADGYMEKSHLKQGPVAFQLTLEKALLQRERSLAQRELRQLKDEFHAVMVHDLRGPASSASVALRMYQESCRPEVLDSAVRSLDRLFYRLDRYLEFSRMENLGWTMNFQTCDLNEVLGDAVSATECLLKQKNRSFHWAPLPTRLLLRLDPDWMMQALENLLTNAAKYSPPSGVIELAVRLDDHSVEVEVSDNGPGIGPELHDQLFRRYARAHPGQGEKGTGLGLLIARQVVEAHGGKIRVRSTGIAGEGAAFQVRLPIDLGTSERC